MPLREYGVLAGRVVGSRAEGGTDTPHFQIHAEAGGQHFRIAVNVLSNVSPSELLYVAVDSFSHPLLANLDPLADGFTPIASTPGGSALDFIRGNLFDRSSMTPMPASEPGPDNDLAEKVGHYTARAQADPLARVFAFGERWGPEAGVPDKIFGFSPGNGVHDIHMNQGNVGSFTRDDGVWQDGGLLFHFPATSQWVAIFLAFQSQSWHTDDTTGHSLPGTPGLVPGTDDPQGRIRIVAALVNPIGPAPEQETVTLINPGAADVSLDGWALVDRLGKTLALGNFTIAAGETLRIRLTPPIQLGNSGGTITLIDSDGLKVDGVAYTKDQARVEGASIVY